jgi:hypothetical protein
MMNNVVFLSSSATSSLNEANNSSYNNLIAPLVSKSATFASTFLANDKYIRFLESVRI